MFKLYDPVEFTGIGGGVSGVGAENLLTSVLEKGFIYIGIFLVICTIIFLILWQIGSRIKSESMRKAGIKGFFALLLSNLLLISMVVIIAVQS